MDEPSAPTPDWEARLPRVRGTLPNGAPLSRTDPSGRFTARVMILGAYPAATATRPMTVGLTRMQLPVAVEAES